MKRFFQMFCLIFCLLPSLYLWAATAHHYVDDTGGGDGSGWGSPWNQTELNSATSTILTELASDDVVVYFKKGDIFSPFTVLNGESYTGENRLYYTVDAGDSGAKPSFQTTNSSSSGWRLIYFYRCQNITFDNLDLRNLYTGLCDAGKGISTDSDGNGGNNDLGGIHITNCDFQYFGHMGVSLARAGDRCVATDNTITHCGNGIYITDEVTDGGNFHYIARNTIIDIPGYNHGCTQTPQDGHAVALQTNSYCIVEDNVAESVRAPFALGAFSGNATRGMYANIFRRNTSKNSLMSMITFASGSTSGNPSYWNLAYQNKSYNDVLQTDYATPRGDLYVSQLKPTATEGNRIFNNTVYNVDQKGAYFRKAVDYIYFKNNIVVTDALTGEDDDCLIYFEYSADTGSHFFIDYNLYWNMEGNPSSYALWENYDDAVKNFAEWQTAGHDAGGVVGDPLLNNPESLDMTLGIGSPAINSGDYLSHVTQAVSGVTSVTVADDAWFLSDMGVTDADGNAVEGMLLTLYDETNGYQDVELVDQTDETNTLTFDISVTTIYDAGHPNDPAYTTQIALRFRGSAPDIGAEESSSADNPPTMVLYSQFDNGELEREEVTDNDSFWTNNNTVETNTDYETQGDACADFTSANSESLSRAGAAGDFNWNVTKECTICADVRPKAIGTAMDFWAKGTDGGSDFDASSYLSTDGSPSFIIGYNAGASYESQPFTLANLEANKTYFKCWAANFSGSTTAGLANKQVRARIRKREDDNLLGGDEEILTFTNTWVPGQGGDFYIGAYGGASLFGNFYFDNFFIYDRALTAAEIDALYAGIDTPVLSSSTADAETITEADQYGYVTINTNCEPFVQGGIPYCTLETGYNDVVAYYYSKTTTTMVFRYLTVPGLSTADLTWKDASLTLPDGCTVKNDLGDDFDLTIPNSGAITNTTVLNIPTDWVDVGSGKTIESLATRARQVEGDTFLIYDDTLDETFEFTEDNMTVRGVGRKRTGLTDVTFSANNCKLECVMASGSVTGAGSNGNIYHPICQKGTSRLGMNPN